MQSLYLKAFNYVDNFKPSHFGIYFSLLLHLSLLLFTIGLPDFFKTKEIVVPQIIPIEILNISDVTSLKPKKESIELEKKENINVKQKKFNSSENIEIQKIDLEEKPIKKINKNENSFEDTLIQKPKSKEIVLKEKQINNLKQEKKITLDNIETLKQKKIKPKLKPKSIEKIESKSDIEIENKDNSLIKKNDKKNIIDKPKPIQKPEPDFNLSTMLKDLRNEDITDVSEDKDQEEKKVSEEEKIEANLDVSISEMDLVLQQLRSCFNPRAGTQIVGDEMVKISAKIDRQANVRKDTVQIIDTNISKSNPYYEAITESAVATLYNPLCSKLKLPLKKYESWKDLKITIDYSWIKN